MARDSLAKVSAPTLLIVGERDSLTVELNKEAYEEIKAEKLLFGIPDATHLFKERVALVKVGQMAADWFKRYLKPSSESIRETGTHEDFPESAPDS